MKPNIIVIGASSGGLEALKRLFSKLPKDLDAAIFAVIHIPSWHRSEIPGILSRIASMPVVHAEDGLPINSGRIYVAPPDHHLLLEERHMSLWKGPKENRSRPAINPLFRSAAINHKERVAGVVLTGTLDDGSAGLWLIKKYNGVTIVQDPHDADFPEMPQNALNYVKADYVASLSDIAEIIIHLTRTDLDERYGKALARG